MSDASLTEEQEFQIFGTIPTSMRWHPIETAPKDQPILIRKLHQIGIAIYNPSIFGKWQLCSNVCFFQEETQANMSNEALPLPKSPKEGL